MPWWGRSVEVEDVEMESQGVSALSISGVKPQIPHGLNRLVNPEDRVTHTHPFAPRLLQSKYLPKSNIYRKKHVVDLALWRLRYIAKITKSKSKSPFLRGHADTLQKAKLWDKRLRQSLWGCMLASFILTLTCAYFGAVTSESSNVTTALNFGVMSTIGFLGLILSVLSYWATGFAPLFANMVSASLLLPFPTLPPTFLSLPALCLVHSCPSTQV